VEENRSLSSTEYNTVEHCEKISYRVKRSIAPNITEKNSVKHGVKHCGTLWNRIRSQSSTEYNTVEHCEKISYKVIRSTVPGNTEKKTL